MGAARKVKGSKAHQELALRLVHLGHLVNIGVSKIVGITFIVIIARLARVKEEMGDKEGAEDLREEAGESFLVPS